MQEMTPDALGDQLRNNASGPLVLDLRREERFGELVELGLNNCTAE